MYNPHKQFGSGVRKMTIGRRSVNRSVSDIPAPGAYDPEAGLTLTKPSSQAIIIKKDSIQRQSVQRNLEMEHSPDPGHYYNSNKGFGYDTPRMTIGGNKPDWKPLNDNPGPGEHDI